MDEKTREWLKSLKVGDKVVVRRVYLGDHKYNFAEVSKITPKGALRVSEYPYLFKEGFYNNRERYGSTSYFIEPITEELKARLLYGKKLSQIKAFNAWGKLEEPIINQVYELIKDYIEVKT